MVTFGDLLWASPWPCSSLWGWDKTLPAPTSLLKSSAAFSKISVESTVLSTLCFLQVRCLNTSKSGSLSLWFKDQWGVGCSWCCWLHLDFGATLKIKSAMWFYKNRPVKWHFQDIAMTAFKSLWENTEHTLLGDYSNSTSMSEQTQLCFVQDDLSTLHQPFRLCSSLWCFPFLERGMMQHILSSSVSMYGLLLDSNVTCQSISDNTRHLFWSHQFLVMDNTYQEIKPPKLNIFKWFLFAFCFLEIVRHRQSVSGAEGCFVVTGPDSRDV